MIHRSMRSPSSWLLLSLLHTLFWLPFSHLTSSGKLLLQWPRHFQGPGGLVRAPLDHQRLGSAGDTGRGPGSASGSLPGKTLLVLSLRGGRSLLGKGRRAKDGGVRTKRRIHGARRPHDIRRREAKRQKLMEQGIYSFDQNETRAMEEDKSVAQPWPVGVGECRISDWIKEIREYKRRCPEVFQEVENTRRDNKGLYEVSGMQELADYIPKEVDDETWFKRREDFFEGEQMRVQKGFAHWKLGSFWEIGYGVERPDLKKAFQHWLSGAHLGNPGCMCNVGVCYVSGQGVAIDESQAFSWFKKASDLKTSEGTLNLGMCYRDGVGTLPDPELAIKCFNESAKDKLPDAMFEMARMHEEGYGSIQKNPSMAVSLYSRLLDKYEHAHGQMRLGLAFLAGEGVEADRDMALKLIARAASNGFPGGSELLSDLMAENVTASGHQDVNPENSTSFGLHDRDDLPNEEM